MGKVLYVLALASALASCATSRPLQVASAKQVMAQAKIQFESCCRIDDSRYNFAAHQDSQGGWTVSATPKPRPPRAGLVAVSGGGDVHLFYDRRGVFKGMYRGQ